MADTTDDLETLETINIYLIGDKEEIGKGITLIDACFREKIVGIIRKKALSANEHDLLDIYQDVMLSILKCATKNLYNPDVQKLEGFIYTVAYRRAAQWVRDKCRIKEKYSIDQLIESTQQIICDSKYDEPWQAAQLEEKRALILANIRRLVSGLKPRQRQVGEIIIEHFPDLLSTPDIKEQILQRYGEDVSTVAVKRAIQEVLNKVKESLRISGYGDFIDD